jgi:hypothetical protein
MVAVKVAMSLGKRSTLYRALNPERISQVTAGFSLLLSIWYSLSALKIALPEPGSVQPFHLTYFHVEPAWAAILSLAYLPVLKYASLSLLLLAFAPPWVLAVASIMTLVVHRKDAVKGLLWALLLLEAFALVENTASLLGLRVFGLVAHIERSLRLAASTTALPLIAALALLGPLKYIERLVKLREEQVGKSQGTSGGRPLVLRDLAPAILLSLAIVSLPYLPTLNPSGKLVGVDPTTYYSEWIGELKTNFTFKHPALRSRPIFVLMIYGLSQLVGVHWSMRIMQMLGFAVFTIAIYYFTLLLTDGYTARLAALLFPFSYTATILLHSGFYNNIFASSFSLPALALIWTALRENNSRRLTLGILFFEIAIFTHPYSTLFYAIALAGSAILELLKNGRRRGFSLLLLSIIFAIQSEIASTGFGEESLMEIAMAPALPLTASWYQALAFVAYNCALNAAIDVSNWLLANKGLLFTEIEVLIGISAVAGGALLVVPLDNWLLKWRALYSMPLPTYYAIALRNAKKDLRALLLLLMINYCLNFVLLLAI